MTKAKFGSLLLLFQAILLILFVVFVDYGDEILPESEQESNQRGHAQNFPVFQGIHVMTFLGFVMIMTFLKRYSRGMLVHALLIGALVIQWATLLQGFFTMKNVKIDMSIKRMINADYAVLAVLISFGALMGKCNSLQLLIVALFETFFFAVNEAIATKVLQISDHGRSILVHMFGAYFGLAVSRMIFSRKVCMSQALSMSNKTEMYAFMGTLFLWVYWPTLNASFAEGPAQHRAISNTYYALAASCVSAFSFTVLSSKEGKFNILHLQNATIAGGVAIGAIASMMIRPWGAIIVGIIGALSSVMGYKYLVPALRRHLKIHDTRGIHAIHGLPGIVSGLGSIIAAILASENGYKMSLYDAFPARAPLANSTKFKSIQQIALHRNLEPFLPGLDRTAAQQAIFQLAGVGMTIAVAIVGGLLTGIIINIRFFEPITVRDAFDDHIDFEETNCIDTASDIEFDDHDDEEKFHDSIRGHKRLLDDDRHSDIIADDDNHSVHTTRYEEKKGSIANSIGKSNASINKINRNKLSASNDDIERNHVEAPKEEKAKEKKESIEMEEVKGKEDEKPLLDVSTVDVEA